MLQMSLGTGVCSWAGQCEEILAPQNGLLGSFLSPLSKAYGPHIEIAKSILEGWPQVKLTDLISSSINGSISLKSGFVRLKDQNELRGVYGQLQIIPVSENYQLLIVVDKKGRVHVFDSESDLEIYDSRSARRENIEFIERFNGSSIVSIDKNLFETEVNNLDSKARSSIVSQYGFDLFEKANASYQLSRLQKAYAKVADIASYATPAVIIFWSASGILRSLGIGTHNFLHQHASNFYFGLVGMALMHAGISSVNPRYRHVTLALAFATNLAANAVEEINFGWGRLNYFGGHQTATDWLDFSSGMLASATYIAIYLTIEMLVKNQTSLGHHFGAQPVTPVKEK